MRSSSSYIRPMWMRPLDRSVALFLHRHRIREPSHDFASVLKHVVQSVQSSFCGVCRDSVPDAFAFETDAFFQARWNLHSSADKSDSIDGCHDRLFDEFSIDLVDEKFCQLHSFHGFFVFVITIFDVFSGSRHSWSISSWSPMFIQVSTFVSASRP